MSPQLKLLLYSRKISTALQQLSIGTSSELYHLNTWSPTSLGYNFLCLCCFKISALLPFLRALSLGLLSKYSSCYYAFFDQEIFNSSYQALCLSWFSKSDEGSLSDRYTNISYESSRSLWILLYLDSCVPDSFPANAILVRRVRLLGQLKLFLFSPYSPVALQRLSFDKSRSIILLVDYIFQALHFDFLFLPYEAQPFQQCLLQHVKAQYSHLKTTGYIHSFLPCIPSEYSYRPGCPQYLLVNGDFQLPVLIKYLGWPKEAIIPVKALRYNYDEARLPPSAHIYLPYDLISMASFNKPLELALLILLQSYPLGTQFAIRNHPVRCSSKRHILLVLAIQNILSEFTQHPLSAPDIARVCAFSSQELTRPLLVIGNSAVILELLNLSFEVLHVTPDPLFDPLAPDIWPALSITQIAPMLYLYRKAGSLPLFSPPSVSSSLYYSHILSHL
jgi:hypothetical protein